MTKILITGGTGLIGKALIKKLQEHHFEVVVLSRNPKKDHEFRWNIAEGFIDKNAFKNINYIIHLTGAGIADKRWTEKRKQEIIDSRVASANLLFQKVKEYEVQLQGFISASAIGFYGAITSDTIFTENDKAASDFIGNVCQQWENATRKFETICRTVILRIGVVLAKNGGALSKMKTPVISPIGSGKQYLPWIHIDDLCEIYLKAIRDENTNGIYNAVAPEHHTSRSFSKTLANSMKRPYVSLGVPAFSLKLIFGEMAVILLEGSRVSSEKIKKAGFTFRFDSLKKALQNLN